MADTVLSVPTPRHFCPLALFKYPAKPPPSLIHWFGPGFSSLASSWASTWPSISSSPFFLLLFVVLLPLGCSFLSLSPRSPSLPRFRHFVNLVSLPISLMLTSFLAAIYLNICILGLGYTEIFGSTKRKLYLPIDLPMWFSSPWPNTQHPFTSNTNPNTYTFLLEGCPKLNSKKKTLTISQNLTPIYILYKP